MREEETHPAPGPDPAAGERARQRVIQRVLAAHEAGESLDRAKLEAEFPELAQELADPRSLLAFELAILMPAATVERAAASTDTRVHNVGNIGPLPDDAVPGYRLIRVIGRGGYGRVFLAWQQNPPRHVAIKLLRTRHASDPRAASLFEREIAVLAALQHPHIVPIHASGVCPAGRYYVMPHIDGLPIDEFVRSRRLPVREIVRLFLEVCDAVHSAHLRLVVHRDLKPGNILVTEEGIPYVLDFGIARVAGMSAGTDSAAVERPGEFIGSPEYSSPEQVQGRIDAVDVRTDVFALGVILYKLLTGAPPVALASSSPDELERIVSEPPEPPSVRRRDLPAELDHVVLRCLEKQRERRFQSVADLAADLRGWMQAAPESAPPSPAAPRRRRKGVLLAAALVAAAAVAAGIWLLRARRPMVPERDSRETLRNLDFSIKYYASAAAAGMFAAPANDGEVDWNAELHRGLTELPVNEWYLGESRADRLVSELVHGRLYRTTRDGGLAPNPLLIDGTPQFSSDHRSCTLVLRRDAQWHDGSPLTARDVAHTLALFRPEVTVTTSADACRVTIATRAADRRVDEALAVILLPCAVFGSVTPRGDQPTVLEEVAALCEKSECVGCGLYRLVNDDLAGQITLERRDEYIDARPYCRSAKPFFKRVTFHGFPDAAEQVEALRNGVIDELELSDAALAVLANRPLPAAVEPLRFPHTRCGMVAWNLTRPLFASAAERAALAQAFDVGGAFADLGIDRSWRMMSLFPPHGMYHEPFSAPLAFDPQAARDALRQRGWELADGVLKKGAQSFEFELAVLDRQPTAVQLARRLRRDLSKIGVHVRLRVMPEDEWESKVGPRAMNVDAAILTVELGVVPDLDRDLWSAGGILGQFGFRPRGLDELYDRAAEASESERKALFREIQNIVYQAQPALFLYMRPGEWAFSNRLRGIAFGISGPVGFYPGPLGWWKPVEAERAHQQ